MRQKCGILRHAMRKTSHIDAQKAVPAPAGYIRALLRRFGTTPELRAMLLAGTEISETDLQNPATKVSVFTTIRFSENLTRVVGEEWPIQALPAWATAMQGALEVAVRASATIGEGVELLARFGHVRAPYLSIGHRRGKVSTKLTLACDAAASEATQRAMCETAAFSAAAMMMQVAEGRALDLVFWFPWSRPKYFEQLQYILQSRLLFEQVECAVLVPNTTCEMSSPYADEKLSMSAVLELERDARLIHGEDMLVVRLGRLFERRPFVRLSEEDAARALGMSRRTLVRRLGESGASFRDLLDSYLKTRAAQFLSDGKLSRAAMAEALGFEDPTSFSRACRRWFPAE